MPTKVKEPVKIKEPVGATAAIEGTGLISNHKLRQLYSTMLQCRMLDERMRSLLDQGKLAADYRPAAGLEATAVGTAIHLRETDAIGHTHRDFITAFVKGAPLRNIFNHLYGIADRGRAASAPFDYAALHVIAPASTTDAQLNIANGIALANKMSKNDSIVVAFSGDGLPSADCWHEAFRFAGAHDLPIVFMCQSDLLAETVGLQTGAQDISEKAQKYGFPGIPVDGNDVVAVYRVAQEAIARARRGQGPTLIEAKTCRWSSDSEVDPAKDPISSMEKYLAGKGLFTPEWRRELVAGFSAAMDAARRRIEN